MNDLETLVSGLVKLVGATVPKPTGTLAGHAAGLPFETLVHKELIDLFPSRCWRHFEFLNRVLLDLDSAALEERYKAFGPKSLKGLLCRGKDQMKGWSKSNQFEEKQNDTAESIISSDTTFNPNQSRLLLLDVKTHNSAKQGQPPNIMSAGKLAEALASAMEEGVVRFDVVYVGVSWTIEGKTLRANNVSVVSLFTMDPRLYINWAAAEQIQFHPHLAEQSFKGSREEWAKQYISHFSVSLAARIKKQEIRLAKFQAISEKSAS
jgi:type II restriction enzyme